jgi:hypothetical protein
MAITGVLTAQPVLLGNGAYGYDILVDGVAALRMGVNNLSVAGGYIPFPSATVNGDTIQFGEYTVAGQRRVSARLDKVSSSIIKFTVTIVNISASTHYFGVELDSYPQRTVDGHVCFQYGNEGTYERASTEPDWWSSLGYKLADIPEYVGISQGDPYHTWSGKYYGVDTGSFTGGHISINYGSHGSGNRIHLAAGATVELVFGYFLSEPTYLGFQKRSVEAMPKIIGAISASDDEVLTCLSFAAWANTSHFTDDPNIFTRPGCSYSDAMYCRDSFWTSLGLQNAALEQAIFDKFANKTDGTTHVPLALTRGGYVMSAAYSESTPLLLIWAYHLYATYGITALTTAKLSALAGLCKTNEYDGVGYMIHGDANCLVDNYVPRGVSSSTLWYFCYAQGVWAMAAKCAHALGATTISAQDVLNARNSYLNMWNQTNGHFDFLRGKTFSSDIYDHLSPTDLMGEYFNLMLFNESFLTNEQMLSMYTKLLAFSTQAGMKYVCKKDGTYTDSGHWYNRGGAGEYQNGASWFMADYLGHYCAYRHGVISKATFLTRIQERLNKENMLTYLLKEHIEPENRTLGATGPSGQNYGWNALALPTYKALSIVPTLALDVIADTTRAETIQITGTGTYLSTVTVNGISAVISGGTWSVTIPLVLGLNSIVVAATSIYGELSDLTDSVTRLPPVATSFAECPVYVLTEQGFRFCRVYQRTAEGFVPFRLKVGRI